VKYQAIIFDMDGTITDTEQIWHQAFKQLLARRNITLERTREQEILNQITGLGLPEKCLIIKKIAGLGDPHETLAQEKLNTAKALYGDHIKLMDGFPEFYQQARQRQLKMGVATNADDETLAITKDKLDLSNFFGKHIYGISQVNNVGKPNPAIYLHAARRLQVDPSACIAIEDSAHGINAARSAGMFCIGLDPTNESSQTRLADLKVRSYRDIDLDSLLALDSQA